MFTCLLWWKLPDINLVVFKEVINLGLFLKKYVQ